MLAAALGYAARGWHVLPCQPGQRRPATRHGLRHATTDPQTLRAWWAARPGMNPAIACGPSGLVVIDCDDLRAKGSGDGHGLDELERLARAHGDPAELDTYTVRSPLAGVHLYYAAGAVPIRSSAGRVAPGVDVRAHGGYVLAPPSTLRDDRALFDAYELLDDREPRRIPGWLEDRLSADPAPAVRLDPLEQLERRLDAEPVTDADRYAAAVLDAVCADVRAAANGTRNTVLHRAALRVGSQVRDRGLDVTTAARELLDAATAAGLDPGEARSTIRRGIAYAMGGGGP